MGPVTSESSVSLIYLILGESVISQIEGVAISLLMRDIEARPWSFGQQNS